MICPHCNVGINFEEHDSHIWEDSDFKDTKKCSELSYGHCPLCDGLIVNLIKGLYKKTGEYSYSELEKLSEKIIFPQNMVREVQKEVPDRYKNDFVEACAVLSISPKASAALSRRILQDVLREELGINKPSLAKEIDEFIQRTDIPSYLTDAVDAIRNVGNFAAHPLKDTNTGTIVEVEAGEAEWLLEVNESLFDFVFVQPKRLEERKNSLNAKLASLGKPPMKS